MKPRALVKWVRKLRQPPHAFFVSYDVAPDHKVPVSFGVTRYPGLLYVQLLRRAKSQSQLVLFWQDEEAYLLAQARVEKRLRVKGLAGDRGHCSGEKFPPSPLTRRAVAFILTLAALVGTIGVFASNLNTLFAIPRVHVELVNANRPDRLLSEDTYSLKVSNHSSVPATVRLLAPEVHVLAEEENGRPGSPVEYKLLTGSRRECLLGSGDSETIGVRGSRLDDGRYQFDFGVTAKAGALWPRYQFACPGEVKLWKPISWVKLGKYEHVVPGDGRTCEARGCVFVGAPSAFVVGTLTGSAEDGISFTKVDCAGLKSTETDVLPDSRGVDVAEIVFRFSSPGEFTRADYVVHLQREEAGWTKLEWAGCLKALEVDFRLEGNGKSGDAGVSSGGG